MTQQDEYALLDEHQRAIYHEARDAGADHDDAMDAVISITRMDQIIVYTR